MILTMQSRGCRCALTNCLTSKIAAANLEWGRGYNYKRWQLLISTFIWNSCTIVCCYCWTTVFMQIKRKIQF